MFLFLILYYSLQISLAQNSIFPYQNGDWYKQINSSSSSRDYQIITNQENNTISYEFKWTLKTSNGVIMLGHPFYKQTKYFPLRIDNNQPLLCTFNFSLNQLTTVYMNGSFIFNVMANNLIQNATSFYQIFIQFYYLDMLYTSQPAIQNVFINNSSFSFYTNPLLYINSILNINGSVITYDFNQFFQDLLNRNLVSPNDYIMSFVTQFDFFGGSGKFTYYQDFPYSTYHYYNDTVFAYNNLQIIIQLFDKNLPYTDYCNVTFQEGSTDLSGLILDYYFQTISNNLKATVSIAYGYINNTWVTPINIKSLPISVDSNFSINTVYSFSHYDYKIFDERVASCWIIIIRSDFNPVSQQITTNSSYPSRQIYICPYWSPSLEIEATFVQKILSNTSILPKIDMRQYIGISYSPDLQYSYPSHTFIYQNNTFNPSKIDLMAFVRWIYKTHNLQSQSDYIVAIQQAFRIHSGKGNFSFLTNQIETQKINNSTNIIFSNPKVLEYVLSILSTPNIGLILQAISPFIDLVNQFYYYTYHKRNYSTLIVQFFTFVNNILNDQWIPSYVQTQINNYYLNNVNYRNTILQNDYQKSPKKIINAGQDVYFIKSVQDYLVSYIPFTVFTFWIFMLAYRILMRVNLMRKLLQNFSNIGFMTISLIAQNIQYLSFWGFTQFYFFVPIGIIGIVDLVITIIFIFIILIYSVVGYFILYFFIRNRLKVVLEGQKYCITTLIYISIIFTIKFLNGFIHSYLYYYGHLQIILLFVANSIYLISIITFRLIMKSRILYYSLVLEQLLKIALHLLFIYEYFLIANNSYTWDINIRLGTIELYLIYSLIILVSIRFLYCIISSINKFYRIMFNKNVEQKHQSQLRTTSNKLETAQFKRKSVKLRNKRAQSRKYKYQCSIKLTTSIKNSEIDKKNVFEIPSIQIR